MSNLKPGKPNLADGYAKTTINHNLTVVSEFYDFHLHVSDGPLVNPVPVGGQRRQLLAHRSPLELVPMVRRAPLRQKISASTSAAGSRVGSLPSVTRSRVPGTMWLLSARSGVGGMTGIEFIVAALAAGAAAGVSNATTNVVQDAYTALREAVRRRLAGHGTDAALATPALEANELDDGVWRAEIGRRLEEAGADRDEELLAAARALLALTNPDGVGAGKYSVDLRDARGVQVGDHNTQTNAFS
ncbi:hypothetical protein ACVMYR_32750 [Micromonospora sp. PTRAS2]